MAVTKYTIKRTGKISHNSANQPSTIKSCYEWVGELMAAVIAVVLVFTFLLRVVTVSGLSMYPNYHDGDRLVISSSYGGALEQGDVVVLVNVLPEPIIKRVIATENQEVDIDFDTGTVYIDGEALDESQFGLENGIDFIAASFIRNADAVKEIKAIVEAHGMDVGVISKIENIEGVENIDAIIDASDGVMIARGDLGVEIPAEEVPFLQKAIIKKCNNAFKPVVTATQMLDSMIRNPRPTRAEVTDVANAIYDGTDAIMLSGETAKGKHPVEAVRMMNQIAISTELHLDAKVKNFRSVYVHRGISAAVAYAAVQTATNVNAKCILASSMSGFTARIVSKFKPDAQIVGLSPDPAVVRKMQLYWGVRPFLSHKANTTQEILDEATEIVLKAGVADNNDVLVLTGGGVADRRGGVTNMLKVVKIGE